MSRRPAVPNDCTWTDRHGTPYLRLPETLPLAPTSDDRLADITRALRQGRHRIDAIRNRAVNRRGARITPPGRADTDHTDADNGAFDDPPPF